MTCESIDFITLHDSLNYLHVGELRDRCDTLGLCKKGNKSLLVFKIVHFLKTGQKVTVPSYPANSCAKGRGLNDVRPDALMLKGTYKNDLKTRIFFKGLIGEHFHFTAFGIDWLNERWMQGVPPTYQEFAEWKRT